MSDNKDDLLNLLSSRGSNNEENKDTETKIVEKQVVNSPKKTTKKGSRNTDFRGCNLFGVFRVLFR